MLLVFFWMLGRGAYSSVQTSRDLTRGAEQALEVDLLDPHPFGVFGRMALRNALVWIVEPQEFA